MRFNDTSVRIQIATHANVSQILPLILLTLCAAENVTSHQQSMPNKCYRMMFN